MDKTPRFNAEIDKILSELKPQNIVCSTCKKEFIIGEEDIDSFKIFKVPAPQNCPECRRRGRFAFANYTSLFKRDCNAEGHTEKIISSIPDGTIFPVYDFNKYWFGDRNWSMNGSFFDFKDNFFTLFKNLFSISPQPALNRDLASVNSDYASYGVEMKNCYYNFGGRKSENVMYSVWALDVKDSIDTLIAKNTAFTYEAVFPDHCYGCNFSYFSNDCLDCSYIYDCKNCSNCFGCVNLRNKSYCIWNKQYSKEEYTKELLNYNLGNNEILEKIKNHFIKMIKDNPIRATRNEHSVSSSGNYIVGSKNCNDSFWVFDSDNAKYVDFTMFSRDIYDCTIGSTIEKSYNTVCVGNHCYGVKMSSFGREISNCEYVMNCKNCQYCFGCIGLMNAKFCILNKQYSEDEYWKLVDEIKYNMLISGEYGEFFPLSVSPFPYNASLSNIIYPISQDEVISLGGWWHNDDKSSFPDNMVLVEAKVITDVKEVSDEILNKGILSERSGKPFRIVKEELEFYRRKNIAIPTLTPYERIVDRFKFVNNFKVFNDKCFNCGEDILSSYATKDGYKPYCDDCYKKEIY